MFEIWTEINNPRLPSLSDRPKMAPCIYDIPMPYRANAVITAALITKKCQVSQAIPLLWHCRAVPLSRSADFPLCPLMQSLRLFRLSSPLLSSSLLTLRWSSPSWQMSALRKNTSAHCDQSSPAPKPYHSFPRPTQTQIPAHGQNEQPRAFPSRPARPTKNREAEVAIDDPIHRSPRAIKHPQKKRTRITTATATATSTRWFGPC